MGKLLLVKVEPDVKKNLDSLKTHERDTYNDVIKKLISNYSNKILVIP